MPLSITSRAACSWEPPRSSSQFADHSMFMSLPLISDLGRATGNVSVAGELVNVS
jgi:hypothetical protein